MFIYKTKQLITSPQKENKNLLMVSCKIILNLILRKILALLCIVSLVCQQEKCLLESNVGILARILPIMPFFDMIYIVMNVKS